MSTLASDYKPERRPRGGVLRIAANAPQFATSLATMFLVREHLGLAARPVPPFNGKTEGYLLGQDVN